MNNIIRSQKYLCRRYIFLIAAMLIAALFCTFAGAFTMEGAYGLSSRTLVGGCIYAFFFMGLIPSLVICFSYTQRIQMYEIMAGFRPHQIILGKTLVYLPIALMYLVSVTAVYLIADSSADMLRLLILYWVLCLRFTLCVIFLSPLFKETVLVPMFFSALVLMIRQVYVELYDSMEEFSHSVFSLTCFGQCALLGGEMTEDFMAKVIISSVIACVIYYLIGYLTLKKKIDLEPHPLK